MVTRRICALAALWLLSAPAVAKGQGGSYSNPIIFADYSDPDVVRVGEDFFMTASSFESVPGLPILHSRDLVHWTIINHAVQRLGPDFDVPQHGNGIWAPSIRYHAGSYYIYYGDPDRGIYVVRSRDPRGKWDEPVLVKAAKGWIDPCPLWDDDGNAYLVHAFANSRAGIKSVLHVNRMSADGMKLLDEGTLVFDGHAHHPTIEGPKFYKRDGWYYIFAPAGGVSTGWQTVLRSRSVLGPYEDRIVMAQGSTPVNGPHQGGWVELANGEGWFIHFQDRGASGRIVHLEPLAWRADGWPVIGADADSDSVGEPVASHALPRTPKRSRGHPQTSDDFNGKQLGLQWQWQANPQAGWWSLDAKRGALRLFAKPMGSDTSTLWTAPNVLFQKFPAPTFTATTVVTPSHGHMRAGLTVFGTDYAYIALNMKGDSARIVQVVAENAPAGGRERIVAEAPASAKRYMLRVSCDSLCAFSYGSDAAHLAPLGRRFTPKAGRWVGAKIGLFTVGASGYADFDFLHVDPQ